MTAPSITLRDEDAEEDIQTESLRSRILDVVKSSKDLTIRPGRLSQELGLSINDASAELCGLLKAVGPGSTFKFEEIDGIQTMVFTFPPDFEKLALANERKEDWISFAKDSFGFMVKVLKVLTAFGLIISTIIVSIAGMAALLVALVALSRGGGDSRHARNSLIRQLNNLIVTVRQLLWFYALFGPVGDDQDPFLREAAYDIWLFLSVCCGNPGSMWFWLRARHLQRRRRRYTRGWGNVHNFYDTGSELEGVSLIRRGAWGEERLPIPTSSPEEHRGLLSVAVEFLFGPTTPQGPSEEEKWKLRGAVITEWALSEDGPISLKRLSPFIDNPPFRSHDNSKVVSECLNIVSHFNGKPISGGKEALDSSFSFPELVAESHFSTNYGGGASNESEGKGVLEGVFYLQESHSTTFSTNRKNSLPDYLCENFQVLTKLTKQQFFQCLFIAVLNSIGVMWFSRALEPGGILRLSFLTKQSFILSSLQHVLVPCLLFYAKLFFCIPLARLSYICCWNWYCKRRNEKRRELASGFNTLQ